MGSIRLGKDERHKRSDIFVGYYYMSDDLNLGWLIHYVSGHRMPKPCKAMGNLKSDTLSLIHHMILWIAIWICLISITAAPPKYYHVLLLSSKYSPQSATKDYQFALPRTTTYGPAAACDLLLSDQVSVGAIIKAIPSDTPSDTQT